VDPVLSPAATIENARRTEIQAYRLYLHRETPNDMQYFLQNWQLQIGHISSIYYDYAQFSPLPTDLKAKVISNHLSHRRNFLISKIFNKMLQQMFGPHTHVMVVK